MSSLEELKKRIYRPSMEKKLAERLDYEYRPEPPKSKLIKKPFFTLERKKILKLIFFGLLFLTIFIIGLFWLGGKESFDKNKIIIELSGSQKIESGEFLRYDFTVRNHNKISLEEVKLTINYPEGSHLQNPEKKEATEVIYLEHIPAKGIKNITSYVKIFGPEDSKEIIKTNLSFIPARLNSRLEKIQDFAVDIISSPLKIIIDAPKIIALNKNVVYTVSFSNHSDNSFKNARLKINYPGGFEITKFSPRKPDISNHTWQFEKILPQEQKEIKITGKLTQPFDIINFSAALELRGTDNKYQTYTQSYSAESFTPAPINVNVQPTNLATPNVVYAGSNLGIIINFQNTTDSVLRDIVLTIDVSGEILKHGSIMPSNQGIYFENENKILWDSRHIPKLAILGPFEAGVASISLGIKNAIPLKDYSDKNFTLEATAKIRPNIVPPELSGIELENSAKTKVKLNSIMKFSGTILPQGNYPLSTSGPRPPVMSQKTSYLITWQLLNYYNDLSNVSVESYLPQGVYWENEWWPKNNNITFDPLTGKLLWQVNELKAGTGLTSPVKQIIFKVSNVPSPSNVGSSLVLLGKSSAQGQDTFTNQILKSVLPQLNLGEKVTRQ
jgi:hypothetical protein